MEGGGKMASDRIEINPAVMLGKPVIRGTRIPVELIIRKLAEGATEADLLDAYPRLTKADIFRPLLLMQLTRFHTKQSFCSRPHEHVHSPIPGR